MFWKKSGLNFDEVYEKYRKKVFYSCYRFTRNNADAVEVSQEVFLKIYENIGKLRNKDGLSSWIYTITANTALNFLKKNYRMKEVACDELNTSYNEKGFGEVEIRDYFESIFSRLSPMEKTVLVMREIDGYSYSEMAGILQCREGTVMSRLFNARKRFRHINDWISRKGGESSD